MRRPDHRELPASATVQSATPDTPTRPPVDDHALIVTNAAGPKLARRHGLTVEELPKRGKGSHGIFVLVDADGNEVGRFGLTGHSLDLSWKVLESTERSLAHLLGEKWTEER